MSCAARPTHDFDIQTALLFLSWCGSGRMRNAIFVGCTGTVRVISDSLLHAFQEDAVSLFCLMVCWETCRRNILYAQPGSIMNNPTKEQQQEINLVLHILCWVHRVIEPQQSVIQPHNWQSVIQSRDNQLFSHATISYSATQQSVIQPQNNQLFSHTTISYSATQQSVIQPHNNKLYNHTTISYSATQQSVIQPHSS